MLLILVVFNSRFVLILMVCRVVLELVVKNGLLMSVVKIIR